MLHLTKLAVGIRDLDHLRTAQTGRTTATAPLCHRTRNMPRRRDDILGPGGSIFWVIAGTLLVRQRILDMIEATWDDGSRCTALMLDPILVQVEGRPVKPFQGWRYLQAADAPADLDPNAPPDDLPATLRNELRALCLI